MAYMHKDTFELFESLESLPREENENYFGVDDAIALSIQMLNKKGYLTEMCCASHVHYVNFHDPNYFILPSFIDFKAYVSLPDLPVGFTQTQRGKNLRIVRNHNVGNAKDLGESISEAMAQLDIWVHALPDYKTFKQQWGRRHDTSGRRRASKQA